MSKQRPSLTTEAVKWTDELPSRQVCEGVTGMLRFLADNLKPSDIAKLVEAGHCQLILNRNGAVVSLSFTDIPGAFGV